MRYWWCAFKNAKKINIVEVPPGFFYNAYAQTMVICPMDQYQVFSMIRFTVETVNFRIKRIRSNALTAQTGQSLCLKELRRSRTVIVWNNYTHTFTFWLFWENCEPGYWCDYNSGFGNEEPLDQCCLQCGKGRYSAEAGSLQCVDCRDGMTTEREVSE